MNNLIAYIPIIAIVIIVITIICIFVWRQNKFKKEFFSKIIDEKYPGATFEPSKGMTKKEYKALGMMKTGTNYTSKDLIIGKTKHDTDFKYSEVKVTVHADKSEITIFNGAIFSFEYNKNFEAPVYICRRKMAAQEAFKHPKTHKIELENEEFNDMFDVYTDDDQTAFYLLTPPIMEKIIQFAKDYKQGQIIGYVDGWIHLAVPKINLFKAPVLGIKSKKNIEKFSGKANEDLNKFSYIVDLLRLDDHKFKVN